MEIANGLMDNVKVCNPQCNHLGIFIAAPALELFWIYLIIFLKFIAFIYMKIAKSKNYSLVIY